MRATSFLVIQLRQIGDVVLTTPIPRILKEARPGCRVAFLTERPSDGLLRGNPHIDEILLNDRNAPWWRTLALGGELRRRRFDVVLDFMGNPRSALLTRLSGAPMRVSYEAAARRWAYTHNAGREGGYAVTVKKNLLGPLGISSSWDRPEIYLSEEERAWGVAQRRALIGEGRRFVTVDPTHRRATRRWPEAHYGELCARLADWGWTPVVLWGPGEEGVARAVVEASGGRTRVAPKTNLREMAALIAAADLHVGNCSAPRHIAVAVGTPTFTVLGSTSAGWTHPAPEHTEIALGLECQPCNRNECQRGDRACLVELSADQGAARLRAWTDAVLGWGGA
ncbi:glycosyltransferase family 9 protein [Deferrisoma sp.]